MHRSRLEIALVAVLVASLAALAIFRGRSGGPGPGSATDPSEIPQPVPCLAASVGPPVDAPPAAEATVETVAPVVAEIRELGFDDVPDPVYLSPAELAERVAEELELDPREVALDERLLTALGAIPESTDLAAEVSELFEEQVAGFYDPETDELVVGTGARSGLDPLDLLILAHELEHALADQALGIPDLEALEEAGEDRSSAARALVEGDAQITTEAYATRALSFQDRASAASEAIPSIPDAPRYLTRSLLFPYIEGTTFVCHLYGQGGWDAVDDAYDRPPTTTAQILFPERYGAGEEARDPQDPRGLPPPWKEHDRRELGAADLLFLFEAPGADPGRALDRRTDRVRAWGGGEVHMWTRGPSTAVAVLLVEHPDGGGLCDSMRTWYRRTDPGARDATPSVPAAALALDGPDRDAVLTCEGGEVRLGIGPGLDVARAAIR